MMVCFIPVGLLPAASGLLFWDRSPRLAAAACLGSVLALAVLSGFLGWMIRYGLDMGIRILRDPESKFNPSGFGFFGPMEQAVREYKERCQQSARRAEEENRNLAFQFQSLQRQKTSVEAIVHSIRDAVLVTDAQDQIVMANPAAEHLLDFPFDPNALRSIDSVIAEESLREKIRKSRNGRIRHVRHELTLPLEGRPRTYDAVFSCLLDGQEKACGVVVVLHDITREKEISQMKNDFVSHVSHELKTPLASINAYAEMLVDGEARDGETIQQFCSIIQGQAQRLNRLIEDILNISRIESGLVKVNRDHHSVALIIRDAVEMMNSYAQEKNITIHAQAPILYDQAFVDRDMISQVVINLLSNAVKYTPAGGSVTIRSEVDEADGRLRVTVSDTGVGIPPEAVEHVFDKFYRVEANNQYAKGTGLGLNLVKQIIETVHGGKVFVTSTVGKGSTFGFELPLAETGRAVSVT
jgi:two-component system phosphate regulon sensor histidine kinase PhoR